MTANEKNTLASFLDRAGDYLKDGHLHTHITPTFEDDAQHQAASVTVPFTTGLSSLPLAYQMDEDDITSAEDTAGSIETTDELAELINTCTACALADTRTNTVPGEGVLHPEVLVIGEGPGADEDQTGKPFVGRAGQLLDKMLAAIALSRTENCFIANVVKCRPPGNRNPAPDEIAACLPYLHRQIALLKPRLILCAGRFAAQSILNTSQGINALRGSFGEYTVRSENDPEYTIPVLCTFHPSAILRDDSLKRPAWEDLKLLKSRLDETK